MNKPSNYDAAIASGDFQPVELGGHTCVIKQVSETKSKSGADMIVVLFDFAPDDKQSGYFSASYNNDTRDQKKWPFNGTCWIMVNDYMDNSKTSRKFKTFCTCFEKSNNCKVQWGDENWGAQFKGKKIGAVYGLEEDEYNGEYKMRPHMKWFCSVDEAKNAKVPDAKYIKNKPEQTSAPAAKTFVQVEDDEIPF